MKRAARPDARRGTPKNLNQTNSSNYVYNSIGELVENKREDRGYEYNAAGLVTRIYQLSNNHTISSFSYNDKGLRHSKTTYALGIAAEDTYYSYDAGGAQVASYTRDLLAPAPSTVLQDQTLYAAGRIGLLDASTGKTLYELSDHLGNVRAVVTASANGAAETVSYTDYYSHGGIMPGRNYQSSLSFPYGYQGQEKDAATGLTNFELRQYDPRIGRWYNPDPYGQHHSPYLAMSNNPVSFTDPDGGWDGDDGYDKAMGDIMKRNNYNFLAACIEANEQMNWNGMSPSDRKTIQGMFGTSYKTQFENRVMDNIDSFGEYTERGTTYYYSEKRGLYGYWKDENTLTGAVKQFRVKSTDPTMSKNHITGNITVGSKFNRIGGDEFLTSLRFKEKLRADIRSGLKIVEAFNPASSAWDAMSMLVYGTDKYGNEGSVTGLVYATIGAFPGGNIEEGIVNSTSRVWEVGAYNELRGVEAGLDAHHVGQQALMKRFIPGYNPNTAPTILVPKLGHTIGTGVVSRSTSGFINVRQVIARDVLELRRVYPQIPNSSIQQLIQMNKTMYPSAFIK